jgi:hypothetical protein
MVNLGVGTSFFADEVVRWVLRVNLTFSDFIGYTIFGLLCVDRFEMARTVNFLLLAFSFVVNEDLLISRFARSEAMVFTVPVSEKFGIFTLMRLAYVFFEAIFILHNSPDFTWLARIGSITVPIAIFISLQFLISVACWFNMTTQSFKTINSVVVVRAFNVFLADRDLKTIR